jgi:hypothetical protein
LAGSVDAGNRLVLGAVEGLFDCLVRVEEVVDGIVGRGGLSSNDLLLLANWNRLAGNRDVLCETFITSCTVDELPEEGYSSTSRSGEGFGDRLSSRGNCGRDGRRDNLGSDLLSNLVCDRNGDGVGDEEVDSGEGGTNKELGDLERGKGSLDDVGDAVAEG